MTNTIPDFFMIGAPKSGTTALASYLAKHPDIYMSEPKEPNYFANDIVGYNRLDKETYLNLFKDRAERCRGEASTIYLYSRDAVPAILECNPDAKFIVLIRDPVKMFASWHNQLTKFLTEDETDPRKAWDLQEQRKNGNYIPKFCKAPDLLQYRETCAIGQQLKRAAELIPKENFLILRQEEMHCDTRGVYLKVLDFLGVDDDGKEIFERQNQSAKPRNRALQTLGRNSFPALRPVGNALRKIGLHPRDIIFKLNLKKTKVSLDESFEAELREVFAEEINLLEEILQKDLNHWRMV